MVSLKAVGYVSVGMVIADVNGNESLITDIVIPSRNVHVFISKLPEGSDLILELNHEQYLYAEVGWENLDECIKIVRQT
ncbi:hypothetical protein NSQ62_07915 [Solibacillus sp. FSL H8-0523]|uniref:hypothetical protein n=1 Tax=Solibacillus sp. FSL H8-0523 TaxID=2954511 RepID=UPI00310141DC